MLKLARSASACLRLRILTMGSSTCMLSQPAPVTKKSAKCQLAIQCPARLINSSGLGKRLRKHQRPLEACSPHGSIHLGDKDSPNTTHQSAVSGQLLQAVRQEDGPGGARGAEGQRPPE